MKKCLIIVSIIAVLLCSIPAAWALQIGSLISVPLDINEEDRLSINAEASIVDEMDLDTKNGISSSVDESTQVGLKIAYGVTQGASFYVKIGMADWSVTRSTPMTIEYENGPYYGGGITYLFKSESNMLIGGDIQYLTQPDLDVDSISYQNTGATNITGLEADFTTIQVSLLCGYNLALEDDVNLIPYGGITYTQFEYESAAGSFTAGSTINQTAFSLDNDDAIGFIAGISMKMGPNLDLSLESRFVSESAFSLGFNFRF